MKLTKNNIEEADEILKVKSENELPTVTFWDRRVFAMVKYNGFYGYTEKGLKVLVITEKLYNKTFN